MSFKMESKEINFNKFFGTYETHYRKWWQIWKPASWKVYIPSEWEQNNLRKLGKILSNTIPEIYTNKRIITIGTEND